MQIGSKKQRGMTLVELAVVPALVVILMMIFPIYTDFQLRNVEISATAYDQLSSIAKMSCSGDTYLKETVARGPILARDRDVVDSELRSRAESQASSTARARIAGTQTSCT